MKKDCAFYYFYPFSAILQNWTGFSMNTKNTLLKHCDEAELIYL